MSSTEVLRLRLERVIRARRERVWDAWTRGDELRKWSAPEGLEITAGETDLRPGGQWRVVMQEPAGGKQYIASGEYREITRPSKLVYTHSWETDDTPVETVLTVELYEEGDSTRLVLTQEGFASAGARDGHEEGWSSTLDRLVALLSG